MHGHQGCQMVCFQTKNPNLGKFWRVLDWKMFKYFMAIWTILWRFGIFCDRLVHFVFIWYIFPVLKSCTKKNLATLMGTHTVDKNAFQQAPRFNNILLISGTHYRSIVMERQCDQTFCEQSAQFWPNIARKGALVNKKNYPKKVLVKIWEFKAKN
jgi:hypothetical protein